MVVGELKLCGRCTVRKPLSAFSRHARTADGLQPYCRDCSRELNARHRGTTAEAVLERRAAREVRQSEAAYVAAMLADPCAYCGEPSEALDHITARSRGGDDHWSNRAGICASCNSAKHTRGLIWFLGYRSARRAAEQAALESIKWRDGSGDSAAPNLRIRAVSYA